MSAALETTPAPAATHPIDFPGWLPAMLVKELRQGLRARGFVAFFLTLHAIAVCIYWFTIETTVSSAGLQGTFAWLNSVFWLLLTVTLLFIIPFRALSGLRTEMDNRTLDLLVLTHLTPWSIVVGKWVALMAQALLFVLAVLPYAVVRYFFGSVDFGSDLSMVALLLLGSGTATAAALWVSTMPKFLRILVPIGMVLFVQGAGMGMVLSAVVSGRAPSGRSTAFWTGLGGAGLTVLVLLLLVFLGLAVRRLAPVAENHAAPARLFGFAIILGALGLAWLVPFGRREVLTFSFAVAAIVSALELSHDRLPMRAHWRPWSTGWKRRIGRMLLPGWPSAAIFTACAMGLVGVVAPLLASVGIPVVMLLWVMSLVWVGLMFPAVLLSFLPASSSLRAGGTGYFVLHGLFGVVSLLSATNSVATLGAQRLAAVLETACAMFPISSFYLTAAKLPANLPTPILVGQGLVFALMVLLSWRQSRPYWNQLKRYDAAAVATVAAEAK